MTARDDPISRLEPFPEELYKDLCDAHCHPHDAVDQHAMIPALKTGHLTLMGVRQDDWDVVASLAQHPHCTPCFGIHPWFTYRVMASANADPQQHYERVLHSPDAQEKKTMIEALERPFDYATWFDRLRQYLIDHPRALLGEVGLDRASRLLPGGAIEWHGVRPTQVQCTLDHQLAILNAQLDLAAELDRAVSIHCVQAQGHLLSLLRQRTGLRLCLHSFGGSPATIPQFMQLKHTIYVSFSVAINGRLAPAKLEQLVCAVPHDRLLIESDLNTPNGLDDAMVGIARTIARARRWSLQYTVQQTRLNWQAFCGLS